MTPNLLKLRNKLADRLARTLRNPTVEKKELAAFDLMITRRQFLKAAELSVMGALVNSALVPTAWGQCSTDCPTVTPAEVGLTPAEMAEVAQATGVAYGTELFQDTIYAQPVVAPTEPYSHGLIEAARSRMRVQSQLQSESPLEDNFLDRGFNFGPAELIQLEQDSNGLWELVHYFHPWVARTDDGRADGLVRHVIMSQAGGDNLTDPSKILCITGSHTNEFISESQGQQVAASYAIYVEQGNGLSDGFIIIGHALSQVESGEVRNAAEYPIKWVSRPTSKLNLPPGTNRYQFADKYVNAGLDASGSYSPTLATEHVVIYLTDVMKIVSLDDATTPGRPILIVTTIPYPEDVTEARFTHIEFNPVAPGAGDPLLQVSDFALTSTLTDVSNIQFFTHSNQSKNAEVSTGGYQLFSPGLLFLSIIYSNSDYEERSTVEFPLVNDRPDYVTLQNVIGLAAAPVDGENSTVHLKVGNFPGTSSENNRGLTLFVLTRVVDGNDVVSYVLSGDFPLAVPDDAGIGKVTGISGGISKFGGLRLFAGDDIGNLFMLRQRRLPDSTTPYAPPIYIQNDSQGKPATFSSTRLADGSSVPGFDQWMSYFPTDDPTYGQPFIVGYNMLLSGVLGFGTSDSNVTQATWLGSSYQAVYAPKRFAHDSEHVVVKQVTDGTSDSFNVFNVFNTPVEKTWHSRLIAKQVTPGAPGLQESGDFYQATINATNIYGTQVALNSDTNPGMQIEIRGDAPTTVIDQSNNKYYDIDRYTSFVALPDPSSNNLRIAVKAHNFAQIIYARLLQITDMSASSSDSAMLNSSKASASTATDWVQINIAANGQQRMAASSSDLSMEPDSCNTGCDDTVYICTSSLCISNQQNTWQTKGDYHPTTDNLDSLSQYLNQSGQNLTDASANTANLSLDATPIDPLMSTTPLTADAGRNPLSTTFDYAGGTIIVGGGIASGGQLDGLFSSISHALHDALHWLQHVEGDVYKSLANGVTIAIDDTENIAVTVSADIMKQVNGVEAELQEVVSTVEEYGSIVLNIVVTIVESSFFFRYIELLIELISLFIHLEDIKTLSNSFKLTIMGLSNPKSAVPLPAIDTDFPWGEKLQPYVGSSNNTNTDMNTANIDAVADEIVNELINAVLNNPFANKILSEVMSVLSRAINAVESSSPLQFNLDESIADKQIQLVDDLADDVESLFVNVTDDAVNFLINQVVDDIENPKQSFTNFASGLGQLMEQVETQTIEDVYKGLTELLSTDSKIINNFMDQDNLMVVDIALLADLFRLFGIGNISGNKVQLAAAELISLPLALIVWTGVFMATGKSIKDVSDLTPDSGNTSLVDSFLGGEPGVSKNDILTFSNATVSALCVSVNGALWTYGKAIDAGKATEPTKLSVPLLGEIANCLRWSMSATTMSIQFATNQQSVNWTNGYLPVFTYSRFITAITSLTIRISGKNTVIGILKPTGIVTALNSFLNLVAIVWSVVDATSEEKNGTALSAEDWAILAGNDVGRAGVFGKLVYDLIDSQAAKDSLTGFGIYVVGTAVAGFGAAATATGIKKLPTLEPTHPGCTHPALTTKGHGKGLDKTKNKPCPPGKGGERSTSPPGRSRSQKT